MSRLVPPAVALTLLFAAAGARAETPGPTIAALPDSTATLHQARAAEPDGVSRADALARLQREGFKSVTRLVRDSEGNWIGAARRGNRVVDVAVDQDGDVIAW